MPVSPAPVTRTDTDQELDQAASAGPLRDITIPSCPVLLVALRKEMSGGDPEPNVIADIAGRDVAMAASLIRTAKSPFYARSRAVTSVSEALGALVARTWHLPEPIYKAVRLHHDSSVLNASHISTEVRTLVAMGLVADHLVGQHEGMAVGNEWAQFAPQCLEFLSVTEVEVDAWVNALHPVFEACTQM